MLLSTISYIIKLEEGLRFKTKTSSNNSPRSRAPSGNSLREPEKRRQASACLTSCEPKMAGEMERQRRSTILQIQRENRSV